MPLSILHLDNELTFLEKFRRILEKSSSEDFVVESFDNTASFTARLHRSPPADLVLLDLQLGEKLTGRDMAELTRRIWPGATILMCSNMDTVSSITDCLAHGADDFIAKSTSPEEIPLRLTVTHNLCRARRGAPAVQTPQVQVSWCGTTMERLHARIPRILESAVTTVHIHGESGTGKELVAEMFEEHLPAGTPFVKFNCGSLAPDLLESELFGHVKGAFTGADRDKTGLLEKAAGGWIFLDEVGTLPGRAQIALLRVLENRTIRRVGSADDIAIDMGVISATNASLPKMVQAGTFRQDLWQRLCEKQIELPPLCDRPDEIAGLVRLFCTQMKGGPWRIDTGTLEALTRCRWRQGNIRQLRNTLRAMTEYAVNKKLTPLSLPASVRQELAEGPAPSGAADGTSLTVTWAAKEVPPWDDLTTLLMLEALRHHYQVSGSLSLRRLSALLGMSRSTLTEKLRLLQTAGHLSQQEMEAMITQRKSGDNRG